MPRSNKIQVLEAYRDFLAPGEWGHVDKIRELAQLDLNNIGNKQAADAAYHAMLAGQMEKHDSEPNTYRITGEGLKYLENPPHQATQQKPRRKKKTGPKKAKATSTPANGTLEFGTILEVVALDGKGTYLARDMETKKAYKVSEL